MFLWWIKFVPIKLKRTFMHIKYFQNILFIRPGLLSQKQSRQERGVCISFELLMLWGVRPRLQAEQVRWSEIVVNERLQVRSSSQWIMVDAGGGCWVQIEGGNERRPGSAGEAHAQVWCSWGTVKERVETERAHKDEEEKQEWAMEKRFDRAPRWDVQKETQRNFSV